MSARRAVLAIVAPLAIALAALSALPAFPQQPNARIVAPVDLTGTWVSVVTEDWAWRMQTPPKGDYASVPLNNEGRRVADLWTASQDGSCLGFGAASMLRVPTRARISWEDDNTLRLETDNGRQTRLLHFDAASAPTGRSLQGYSIAEWQTNEASQLHKAGDWASLKVVTTRMQAAWLRPNGVPYSENAVLTEYFDRFSDAETQWFAVTIIVEDPAYLTEPFVISSNFKREPSRSQWNPTACTG
jgi:hypothetical protein